MKNSPAEILRALLTQPSGSLFTDPDVSADGLWPLYVQALPDGDGVQDHAAAVYDTDGRLLGRFLASGRQVEGYGLQVRVRASGYNPGYAQMRAMTEFLSTVRRQPITISSNSYVVDTILRTSSVISLGQDERRRSSFTVNFVMLLL